MPHIHTEPGQYDHTASAFLFRTDFAEPKVMLHLHKKYGCYMQFGGHIELNESPWQAITHELREESGYDITQVSLSQPHIRIRKHSDSAHTTLHPQPVSHATHKVSDDHFHTDTVYALTTAQEPQLQPEAGESTHIQLFNRAELAALSDEKIYPNIRETALFIFDEVLPNWEVVSPAEYK